MNLLYDGWIPVRLIDGGTPHRISLKQLLCGEEKWEICLPRDDMELAAMQLLICLTQALFTPKDGKELLTRFVKPIAAGDYETAAARYDDWFCVDHPKWPFMQVKGVAAKEPTPMDKLFAGVTGATNSCFVNQPGLVDGLCGGCTAIALFNQASCTPSFGGGFKAGLRGSSPITTLIQGVINENVCDPDHLRRTVWLNVLHYEEVKATFTWHEVTSGQKPTWMEPIKTGETPAQRIGFVRGLLWQPAHIELLPPVAGKNCSCCGFPSPVVYTAFNKAKFKYTITDTWPHPHSPRITTTKKGKTDEKFAAFTTTAPAWTQLSRFLVQQQIDADNNSGQQPASVVTQARKILPQKFRKLNLLVGGYRNNQASVLERRHEVFTLNHGWDKYPQVIDTMIELGRGYRDALYKAIFVFTNGVNDVKGAGVKLNQFTDTHFYRRSEPTIEDALARIDFADPGPELTRMRNSLKSIVFELFKEVTRPYLNDPELVRTLAVARRTLYKHTNSLEPQQNKGGNDGTTAPF